ncbi:MAG: hypothetical protein JJLCMIEE_03426 [Acidimicrobiales bacterium]|nr:MAG: CPBP family intramembrane metalloprotease [Actinomycetota bacterium]MBV6510287.1 hypothetical protein [Acidimicrobiales bacterium]RIK03371.1 MAG: hypothetical protein DCC48_16610 [Acidobacteriota bacterium]
MVVAVGGYSDVDALPLSAVVIAQTPLWVVNLAWPVLVARRKGNGAVRDFGLTMRWTDAPLGLSIGVATQLVVLPLLYLPLLWLLGDRDVSEAARQLTERADDALGVVLLVVMVGIAAPMTEEIFYRGLFLRALERRFANARSAGYWRSHARAMSVVVSALVFGAVHFQALQFLGLFAFGLIAGTLTVRFGRLGPAMWAHLGFNLTTVALLLWF